MHLAQSSAMDRNQQCKLSAGHSLAVLIPMNRSFCERRISEALKPIITMLDIVVEPSKATREQIVAFVQPVTLDPRQPLTTRLIIRDHRNREYVSDKVTFRATPPSTATAPSAKELPCPAFLLKTIPTCVCPSRKSSYFRNCSIDTYTHRHTICVSAHTPGSLSAKGPHAEVRTTYGVASRRRRGCRNRTA